jgi:DNA segregation ATPase FtsK/SpoIIIE, S-DNA-T family
MTTILTPRAGRNATRSNGTMPSPRMVIRHEVESLSTEYSLTQAEAWLTQLRQLVEQRAQALSQTTEATRTSRQDELRLYRELREQLLGVLDHEAAEMVDRQTVAESTASRQWEQQLQELAAQTNLAIHEIDRRHDAELAAAVASRDETTWLVGSLLDEQAVDSPRQQLARLHAQIDGMEQTLQDAIRTAEDLRVNAADYLLDPVKPPSSLDALQERCLEEVQLVEAPCRELKRLWLPKCFRGFTPLCLWLLMGVVIGGPVWWFLDPQVLDAGAHREDPAWIAIVAGAAAAIGLVTLLILHSIANQRAFGLITQVFVHSRAAQALFARWERLAAEELAKSQEELDRKHLRRNEHRHDALTKATTEYEERSTALAQWRRSEVQRLQTAATTRRSALEAGRDQERQRLLTTHAAEQQRGTAQRESAISEFESAHRQRMEEIAAGDHAAHSQAWHDWQHGLATLTQQATNWNQLAVRIAPEWSDWSPSFISPSPARLKLGTFDVALADLPQGLPDDPAWVPTRSAWSIPAWLDLSDRPAMVITYQDAASRPAAADLLQAAMLRLLSILPAGQVRFTILDPVSLGENFATFMHLGDVDDLLITTKIWTEPHDIEERLADLTEHLETVLQMFLRNEFATLDEYNRQAGEVASRGCQPIAQRSRCDGCGKL